MICKGRPVALETRGDDPRRACVFEDDGATGYLYMLIYDGSGQPIKDAVQIYGVHGAVNDEELTLEFRWSSDHDCCGLFLDGELEGYADFESMALCSRLNFPAISIWTGYQRFSWDERFRNRFD